MPQIDPQFLSLPQVIPIMDDLFSINEKLLLLIEENIEILKKENVKGGKIFNSSSSETTSIVNILNYAKRITELEDNYEEIKLGNVYKSELDKFNKLNNKFGDLRKNYSPFLQKFRNDLKRTKEFTEIEKEDIENNFGKKLYETMDIENNILKIIVNVLENNVKESVTQKHDPKKENPIEELTVGSLVYTKDGPIQYKQKPLKMRYQIKTLCILFMKNHKKFVNYDDIRDELIDVKKRHLTTFTNITKYVSELHKLLKKHFKRDVIFNQGKEGYIFDTERDS